MCTLQFARAPVPPKPKETQPAATDGAAGGTTGSVSRSCSKHVSVAEAQLLVLQTHVMGSQSWTVMTAVTVLKHLAMVL